MELFLEIIFEVYLNLAELLVPEHKFKKWQESLLKVLGILVSVAIFGCIAAGIGLLVDGDSRTAGIVLLSVGGGALAIQIVLFAVVLVYQIKKEKREKSSNESQDN